MRLYLFRHGIAADRTDPTCPPDPNRPLTEKGIRRTRLAAAGFARLCPDIDLVITSPYERALQTTDILLQELELGEVDFIKTDAAVPEADPGVIAADLPDWYGRLGVLLVGHAPHLDSLMALLLGVPGGIGRLKKAAVAELDWDGETWSLIGMYPPRALRILGYDLSDG